MVFVEEEIEVFEHVQDNGRIFNKNPAMGKTRFRDVGIERTISRHASAYKFVFGDKVVEEIILEKRSVLIWDFGIVRQFFHLNLHFPDSHKQRIQFHHKYIGLEERYWCSEFHAQY